MPCVILCYLFLYKQNVHIHYKKIRKCTLSLDYILEAYINTNREIHLFKYLFFTPKKVKLVNQ